MRWNGRGSVTGLACAFALAASGCSSSSNASSNAAQDSGAGGQDATDATAAAGDAGSDGAAASVGPGAALKCDSSGQNAFDTYGAAAFVAVNEAIFAKVQSEIAANGTTNLGTALTKIGSGTPPTTKDDAQTFKGKLAAFLVWAYGGPAMITYTDNKSYVGPQDMTLAHQGFNITNMQYDYFVANIIVPALTGSGVKHGAGGAADPNDVTSCFAPVVVNPAFKATIVGD